MYMTKVVEEKFIEHPLESIFDIEPGTTVVENIKITTPVEENDEYDNKDRGIEDQLQTISDTAMSTFDSLQGGAQGAEPKYQARIHEVAVQYLNAALTALKERSMLKQHKDKLSVAKQELKKPSTINNNLIVDRNTLLKMISETSNPSPIDTLKITDQNSDG